MQRQHCQWQNPSSMSPRFRGMGRGRRTRRTLSRGGAGPAQQLNDALGRWPGVKITPMFGRWGYFVGARLFACFPLRAKQRDLWLWLSQEDQARALRDARFRPHRRFARRGWVELDVAGPAELGLALRWLRRAWARASHEPTSEG
jgi:hypothetical protein